MFGNSIPCVGVSFGIDRIFTILKARGKNGTAQSAARRFDVYVMAFGSGLLTERMALARELWAAGISAEYSLKVKPKLQQQFKFAEVGGARAVLIIGEEELKSGKVRLKILGLADDDPEKDGRLVTRQNVVSEVKKLLQ
jgi:histidyl-tRNA synthetase